MDPRLGRRALGGLISLAALAGAAELARARQPIQADQALPSPGPPPAAPPGPTGAPPPIPSVQPSAEPGASPAVPIIVVPTPPAINAAAATPENAPGVEAPASPRNAASKPHAPPVASAGPPPAARGPFAVLQVLDKVTAETLKFEAPIGRPVRYKTLVFTVRVCATRGPDDAQPRPSAYLVIDSEALALPGRAPPPAKEVFKGWMFANAPGLHPLEHPIYDAWLVACSAAAPAN